MNGKRRFDGCGNELPRGGAARRDPISAIVGAGTSLIGGILGHNAANSAAKMQQEAAAQAGKGVTDATNQVNPGILQAAKDAGTGVTTAAGTAAQNAADTAAAGSASATKAAQSAASGATDAATAANAKLDPYAAAGATASGVLNTGIAPGGDFNKMPTMADLQIDPGYAFRLQQGTDALTRSAAAHGAVGGGGFQKDLNNYVQGSASQEYQNAFNRFETSTQNRFGNVNAVSNAGQNAAGQQGGNLINAAQYGGNAGIGAAQFGAGLNENASQFGGGLNTGAAQYAGTAGINAQDLTAANTIGAAKTAGDYLTQGANAAAAGKVAGTNALVGGISNAAGPLSYGLDQIFKNPGANYFSAAINPYGSPGAINPGYPNLGPPATPPFVGSRP